MSKVKLPMPAGLILERAAAKGLAGAVLADAVRYKNRPAFQETGISEESIDFIFEYGSENMEICENAILQGYEFKFLSIRGLQNFLIARLGLEEGKDFTISETHLDRVVIPAEKYQGVRETIPGNWVFAELEQSGDGGIYRIEHASAGSGLISKG
ncbi:hypothetical protein ACFFJY_00150 [Fictibacillus aquaticus]|uniref:Uncharacterized protein n=1 Tax=Fictibacillus aquaticus TaxID=2021314 RepID=A0A235F728_9BACL|nr:hypothetical protein [Fictibacillus aquaticus]OYD57146.1 hypothetical protein CGZ90_10635 [Fictibacillus aquaticus]